MKLETAIKNEKNELQERIALLDSVLASLRRKTRTVPTNIHKPLIQRIKELLEKKGGLTVTEIAATLGVTYHRVWYAIKYNPGATKQGRRWYASNK